jgi:hypothetical protein
MFVDAAAVEEGTRLEDPDTPGVPLPSLRWDPYHALLAGVAEVG